MIGFSQKNEQPRGGAAPGLPPVGVFLDKNSQKTREFFRPKTHKKPGSFSVKALENHKKNKMLRRVWELNLD
jgi:hypothetical protein